MDERKLINACSAILALGIPIFTGALIVNDYISRRRAEPVLACIKGIENTSWNLGLGYSREQEDKTIEYCKNYATGNCLEDLTNFEWENTAQYITQPSISSYCAQVKK